MFGAEFLANHIKAFANIADKENMRRLVTQAFKNKKAAKRRIEYKKHKSYSTNSTNHYDYGNSYDRRAGSFENTPFKSSLKVPVETTDQQLDEFSSNNRYESNEHIYHNTLKNLNYPDSTYHFSII